MMTDKLISQPYEVTMQDGKHLTACKHGFVGCPQCHSLLGKMKCMYAGGCSNTAVFCPNHGLGVSQQAARALLVAAKIAKPLLVRAGSHRGIQGNLRQHATDAADDLTAAIAACEGGK